MKIKILSEFKIKQTVHFTKNLLFTCNKHVTVYIHKDLGVQRVFSIAM